MSTTSRAHPIRLLSFGGCFVMLLLVGAARGQDYAFTTIAGAPGGVGTSDGPGALARFGEPRAVTVDGNGNLFVTDTSTQGIRKIAANGFVTTLDTSALYEDVDFFGTWDIGGLATNSQGNLFVSQYYAGPVGGTRSTIWKISPEAVVSDFANLGTSAGSSFDRARGVGIDREGNLYVAETDRHTIRKISQQGIVSDLAGSANIRGDTDGTGGAARFNRPEGIAADSLGNIFVADTGNHAIRKITATGVVTTFAGLAGGRGSADGRGSAAQFNAPAGVAVDAQGYVYVADTGNHTIRKITPDGIVTTVAGVAGSAGSAEGKGGAVRFNAPTGVAVDPWGNLFVADSGNHTIRLGTTGPPVIATQPLSQTIARGRTAMLSITAGGAPGISYQWMKDGVALAGATNATLILAGVSAANAGSYVCVVTAASGSTASTPATLTLVEAGDGSRLRNFSLRASVSAGRTVTAGFVLDGSAHKTVLIRGVGPTLAHVGVGDALADPRLEVFSADGRRIGENDYWPAGLATVFTSTGAFPFPSGSRDAAILLTLPAGAYTAVLSGIGGAAGEALLEIYEAP